ncbi:hypothetical protein L227DRAFT_602221 [Lentinus tigrinus ALCF2SS1-6]|uniref:Uncharacterized protein n=1 Tax=Lentinus tigrinus ALCF2SS1-6 TaxID=1328759 RepID=A0A5C2S2T1_9APHY|nr:hypothetical protein L227DRAFT_602221 [Lentinus tigrinus ALCF2SS1-6]
MVLSLFPLPHHYAIIRTDPEAMVKDLGFDDPETLKEAQGMSRKKYLVYLDGLRGLPVPGDRWCRYYVCPLGTTLRPPDEARGITSDMAIPIAPNKVRVRIHGDGVEHDGAIYLPPRQQSILEDAIFDDYHRMNALYREKCASPSTALAADASEHAAADPRCEGDAQGTEQPAESQAQNGDPTHLGLRTPSGFPSQSCDSLFEDLLGFDDAQTEQLTVTTVTSRDEGIDLFGWDPNMNIPRIPLVEAWLDLENHLTEDSITSPLELQKEFKQIAELITRGLKRFASARKSPEQIKDQHPVSDAELPPEPGELADNDHWIEVITSLWRDLQYDTMYHVTRLLWNPLRRTFYASSNTDSHVVPEEQPRELRAVVCCSTVLHSSTHQDRCRILANPITTSSEPRFGDVLPAAYEIAFTFPSINGFHLKVDVMSCIWLLTSTPATPRTCN